jgi:hypothetical protein
VHNVRGLLPCMGCYAFCDLHRSRPMHSIQVVRLPVRAQLGSLCSPLYGSGMWTLLVFMAKCKSRTATATLP